MQYSDAMVINAGLAQLPDLYRPELWFDYGHLTAAGAEEVSLYIGAQMCHKLQAK